MQSSAMSVNDENNALAVSIVAWAYLAVHPPT